MLNTIRSEFGWSWGWTKWKLRPHRENNPTKNKSLSQLSFNGHRNRTTPNWKKGRKRARLNFFGSHTLIRKNSDHASSTKKNASY
jgi:hypothetical protein